MSNNKVKYLAEDVVGKELEGIPMITVEDTAHHNKQYGCNPVAYYPYINEEGDFLFYYVRYEVVNKDGNKEKATIPYTYHKLHKQWNGKLTEEIRRNKNRPLYNLPDLLTKPKASIILLEGEKTAEAARILVPDWVPITSSGGSNSANSTDWYHVKDRNVMISADCDEAGEKYFKAVVAQCRKAGAKSIYRFRTDELGKYIIKDDVVTEREGDVPAKYDLADSLADGWTPELFKGFFEENKERLVVAVDGKSNKSNQSDKSNRVNDNTGIKYPKDDNLRPDGLVYDSYNDWYELREDGVYICQEDSLGRTIGSKICGYLKAVAGVSDTDNDNWGTLLNIKDKKGNKQELIVYNEDIINDKSVPSLLARKGLKIKLSKGYYDLNNYINSFTNLNRWLIEVSQVGWQRDGITYIMPTNDNPNNHYQTKNSHVERAPEEYILKPSNRGARRLYKNCTLKEWQENVGKFIEGNTILRFCAAAALASTLLTPLQEKGCCFHLGGSSSKGKSTGLQVACSIWGFKDPYSFRSTDNGAESSFAHCNDGLMPIDELHQAKPEHFEQMIYMFGNGVGKTRADRNGDSKEPKRFNIYGLSTGEIGMEAKLAEKGKKVTGGQGVRFMEIIADRGKGHGAHDNDYGYGDEFSAEIAKRSQRYLGAVIDVWLEYFVDNREYVVNKAQEIRKEWLSKYLPKNVDGQVSRVAKSFALVAAADKLAVESSIFNLTSELWFQPSQILFDEWIENRGGTGSHEYKQILGRLRNAIHSDAHSKFIKVKGDDNQTVYDALGYKADNEFWFYPEKFDEVILEKRPRRLFMPELMNDGYIANDNGRYTLRKSINGKRKPFIVVPASIFNDKEEEAHSSLQKEKALTITTDEATDERAAIFAEETGLDYEIARIIIKLLTMDKPAKLTDAMWRVILKNIDYLIADECKILKWLIAVGWGRLELFGCAIEIPEYHHQSQGLVMRIPGGASIGNVTMDRIEIVLADGSKDDDFRKVNDFKNRGLVCEV